MNLLDLYQREAETSAVPILLMGAISGIAQSALLGVITIAADTASQDSLNFRYFLMFVVAFTLMIIGKRYALRNSIVLVEEIIKKVRIRLSSKIRDSELLYLENLGRGEIYTRIANDTNTISQAAPILINSCQAAIMVLFCMGFIAILSRVAFLIALISTTIASIIYLYHHDLMMADLHLAIQKEGKFFEMINDILAGFKELKMNTRKSHDYFRFFKQLADESKKVKINVGFRFTTDMMYSHMFFYTLIAIIIFIMPKFELVQSGLTIRLTAAILFIIGPLTGLVGAIPDFARASVAVQHIYALEQQFDAIRKTTQIEGDKLVLEPPRIASFKTIAFNKILFSYTDPVGNPLFTIGPLNFTITQGETVFIVGGNGSGKTTLLKVLAGLYYPVAGTITVDDVVIDPTTYQAYREMFAVIFGDFHLFDRLYGVETADDDHIRGLLRLMELDQKTDVVNGAFTNLHLSTGQRKRLAMIVALLEERPFYIFDEWAADQDPIFRQYFYDALLKTLKAQGKTIIAVSHDDRYFHFADRVVKMEYGQFISM